MRRDWICHSAFSLQKPKRTLMGLDSSFEEISLFCLKYQLLLIILF